MGSRVPALCAICNNVRKQSKVGHRYHVYLDFLLRPLPSDSYEGVVW